MRHVEGANLEESRKLVVRVERPVHESRDGRGHIGKAIEVPIIGHIHVHQLVDDRSRFDHPGIDGLRLYVLKRARCTQAATLL